MRAVVGLWVCLAGFGIVAGPGAQPSRAVATASVNWDDLEILGEQIAPGEEKRLTLKTSESFSGTGVDTPVQVIRGRTPGPTVCLVAGIHGDELNGIEIVRQVFETLTPELLSGTLIGLPVASVQSFRRSSRYLPDRRDLNRYFPGHPKGSSASRIAHAIFDGVVRHCEMLVDFHTGSFHRSNLPQLRADLFHPEVTELARRFGIDWVVHSQGQPGTLRRSAVDAGIPTITYEAGEPMRFQQGEITRGVQGTRRLLTAVGMIDSDLSIGSPKLIRFSTWVRVNDGGIYLPTAELGDVVEQGEILATVTDPITNERSEVTSPIQGIILGMALPQVVIPGFAAFHLGLEQPVPAGMVPAPVSEEEIDVEERPE